MQADFPEQDAGKRHRDFRLFVGDGLNADALEGFTFGPSTSAPAKPAVIVSIKPKSCITALLIGTTLSTAIIIAKTWILLVFRLDATLESVD